MARVSTEMSTCLGREPTVQELAKRTQLNTKTVRRYRKAAERVRSLEEGADTRMKGKGRAMKDNIMDSALMPQEQAHHLMVREDVRSVVAQLPQLEREVISLRH